VKIKIKYTLIFIVLCIVILLYTLNLKSLENKVNYKNHNYTELIKPIPLKIIKPATIYINDPEVWGLKNFNTIYTNYEREKLLSASGRKKIDCKLFYNTSYSLPSIKLSNGMQYIFYGTFLKNYKKYSIFYNLLEKKFKILSQNDYLSSDVKILTILNNKVKIACRGKIFELSLFETRKVKKNDGSRQ